jgi:hypothetical protein
MHTILLTNEMSSEIVYIPYLSLDMAGYSYSLCLLTVLFGPAVFDGIVQSIPMPNLSSTGTSGFT